MCPFFTYIILAKCLFICWFSDFILVICCYVIVPINSPFYRQENSLINLPLEITQLVKWKAKVKSSQNCQDSPHELLTQGYHGWSASGHPAVSRKSRSQKNVHPNSKLIPEFGSLLAASVTWLQSSVVNPLNWSSPLGPGWSLSVMYSVFPGTVGVFLTDASGHWAKGSFFIYSFTSNEILS